MGLEREGAPSTRGLVALRPVISRVWRGICPGGIQ